MTGWVRYYISDSSGIGIKEPHYVYLPGIKTIEDAEEYILKECEDWTNTSCSYSLKVELDVTPHEM